MPAPMTEHDVLRIAQTRVLSLPEARADVCQAAVALKAAFVEDAMRQSPAFWNAVGGVIESAGRLQNIDISGEAGA